ncbi:TPA: hypothetical protein N0F65_000982 [Lagenidium giganteum]|uniref:Uncharacterized protein n=1 Tax=Lagenidium giganteum TaxID=4803 RepID=A0AAV2Z000_9STRA|nr:TPA: hypothetical protein N0F65_000982 [Lagenidium giganteum]
MANKEIFDDLNLVFRLNKHIEAIAGSQEASNALLEHQTSFKVLAELSSITTPDPRADAQFEHQTAPFLASIQSELPFHLQGDLEFNEASVVAKRRALRQAEAVRAKIAFLWDVAQSKKRPELALMTTATTGGKQPRGAAPWIGEEEYTELMLLVFKVLREDFDMLLAQRQIRCDWEVDCHHSEALTFEQFFSAIFELVDIWTCDVLEATYVRFLELLIRRITVRVVVFLDDRQLKLALSDNFDDAVVVKAIPLKTIKHFAPIAKVLEPSGLKTVGELAAADPRVVEAQRKDYMRRHSVTHPKLGRELTHLLTMFNTIQAEFNNTKYRFENMVLRREPRNSVVAAELPAAIKERADGGDTSRTGSANLSAASTGGRTSPDNNKSAMNAAEWARRATVAAGSGAQPGGAHVSFQTPPSLSPTRRGVGRISTIRDLSVADTGIINALRTTFLIDKGIALQKTNDITAVRRELQKFGIAQAASLGETEAQAKYDELYGMFVLRDGENLKALAENVLGQIRLELAAHGIDVDDTDAEEAYDDFYGSIIEGSGAGLVQEAKDFMNNTLKNHSLSEYTKDDYHAFKSVDAVQTIGTEAGDEAFMALLSQDDDEDEDEDSDNASANNSGKSSSLERHASDRFKGDLREPAISEAAAAAAAKAAAIAAEQEAAIATAAAVAEAEKQAAERAAKELADAQAAANARAQAQAQAQAEAEAEARAQAEAEAEAARREELARLYDEEQAAAATDAETQNVESAADASSIDTKDDAEKSTDPTQDNNNNVLNAPTNQDHDTEDDANRAAGISMLRSAKSQLRLNLEAARLRGLMMEADNSNAQGIQGVDFEYENDDVETTTEEPKVAVEEKPVALAPKIPQIVIGGTAHGLTAPIAARYMQLLGLGKIVSTRDEAELVSLLQSDIGRAETDLVCFDVGAELHVAVAKTCMLQDLIGRRVIIFGGDPHDVGRTHTVAQACLDAGAIHFAMAPLNYPQLRAVITKYLEESSQPYILRQRKQSSFRGGAAFRAVSSSIGAANMLTLHDDQRKPSSPVAYANRGSMAKKKSSMLPVTLPAVVSKDLADFVPLKALDEIKAAETTTAPMTPTAPRSLKSYKKSPRLSAALNKLIR